MESQDRTGHQQPIRDSPRFAVRQYTKALEQTRKALEMNDQPILVTLMSCILFFCFDSLRGQMISAIVHLRSGLSILHSSHLTIDGLSEASKTVINENILTVFARLGFQANYFVDKTHPVNQIQLVSQLKSLSAPRPKRISTLEEAQVSLYACFNRTMFADHAKDPVRDENSFTTKYHITKCAQFILDGERSDDFEKGRENALFALKEWDASFNEFLHARERLMIITDVKRSTLLKLHHSVAMLMLTTSCGSAKGKYNAESAIHGFKQIIEWSTFLLATDQSITDPVTSAFSPHVGIIAPLFFVATQCPDSDLQKQAKQILASGPRREGMWDASVAVKILDDLNI
jgi:hypothetical protein